MTGGGKETDNIKETEIENILSGYGALPDQSLKLFDVCIALAAPLHPGLKLQRFGVFFNKQTAAVKDRFDALIQAGAEDTPHTQLAALKHVIADCLGWQVRAESPDFPAACDMIALVDSGYGGATVLAVFYAAAAQAAGWGADFLDVAGCPLIRLTRNGQRVIFDPAQNGKIMDAGALRGLVKERKGATAELSAGDYQPLSARAICVFLQNRLKSCLIEAEDYNAALDTVQRAQMIAPDEYRLLFDAAVLYARLSRFTQAEHALTDYLARVPPGAEQAEALRFLDEIRRAASP